MIGYKFRFNTIKLMSEFRGKKENKKFEKLMKNDLP